MKEKHIWRWRHMAGYRVKDFETVVMDGSNISILSSIINQIDKITEEKHGKSTYRSLDSAHPTMMVVTTRTSVYIYCYIADRIDNLYPGLCAFNPQM
jgi:hypothetical protein